MRAVLLLVCVIFAPACSSDENGADAASIAPAADGGADAAADAGLLPFGAACLTDDQCASDVCFVGGMRSFCTTRCTIDTDCPNPPSDGTCNMKGFCRAP